MHSVGRCCRGVEYGVVGGEDASYQVENIYEKTRKTYVTTSKARNTKSPALFRIGVQGRVKSFMRTRISIDSMKIGDGDRKCFGGHCGRLDPMRDQHGLESRHEFLQIYTSKQQRL